jgi:hypothetical protein
LLTVIITRALTLELVEDLVCVKIIKASGLYDNDHCHMHWQSQYLGVCASYIGHLPSRGVQIVTHIVTFMGNLQKPITCSVAHGKMISSRPYAT